MISGVPSLFKDASCILIHDSFPDFNSNGEVLQGSNRVAEKIKDTAKSKKIPLVLFSNSFIGLEQGAITELSITGINKRLFYKNLKDFLIKVNKDNEIEIKILAYGNNFVYKELESLYSQIASYINIHGIELARKNAATLVSLFGDLCNSPAKVEKEFSELNARLFLNYLDKIIKSFIRYGRNIYS